MSAGNQIVILVLSDGTEAIYRGPIQIPEDKPVSVKTIRIATRQRPRKHKWRKVGESLWECRVCGAEGAGYHPEQYLSPVCPGKEGA
ncbi:hypothetical protein D3C87_777500 [compost metagenome]